MRDSDDWFRSWKHRREDEHIFHCNDQSLINFMTECDFELVDISNFEDTIRRPVDDNKNILTGIFKKKSNR